MEMFVKSRKNTLFRTKIRNSNPKTVLLNLHYAINLKEGDYKTCYKMIILDFGIWNFLYCN